MIRQFRNIITVLLMCVLLTCSVSAKTIATDNENPDSINSTNRTASYTVTDPSGNKYKITGFCGHSSNKAQTTTSYNTTHYVGGTQTAKDNLNQQIRTLSSSGNVAMQNGLNGASTSYTGTLYTSGASGSYTRYSDSLLYSVISIQGAHYFSCNGGSGSGTSSWSIY